MHTLTSEVFVSHYRRADRAQIAQVFGAAVAQLASDGAIGQPAADGTWPADQVVALAERLARGTSASGGPAATGARAFLSAMGFVHMRATPAVVPADSHDTAAFSGVAYSGDVVNGGRVVIDLSSTSIRTPIPLLFHHAQEQVVGRVDAARNSGQELTISGEVYADNPLGRGIRDKGRRGHPWQLSVGVFDFETQSFRGGVVVNGRTIDGPIEVLRGGRVREVSVVSVGADARTSMQLQVDGSLLLLVAAAHGVA